MQHTRHAQPAHKLIRDTRGAFWGLRGARWRGVSRCQVARCAPTRSRLDFLFLSRRCGLECFSGLETEVQKGQPLHDPPSLRLHPHPPHPSPPPIPPPPRLRLARACVLLSRASAPPHLLPAATPPPEPTSMAAEPFSGSRFALALLPTAGGPFPQAATFELARFRGASWVTGARAAGLRPRGVRGARGPKGACAALGGARMSTAAF